MRDPVEVVAELEAALGEKLGEASQALLDGLAPLSQRWDCIDGKRFGRALARRVTPDSKVTDLHLEDVLLAEACLARDSGAILELDARLEKVIDTLRRRISNDGRDELRQQLRIRLLVPTGTGPARLEMYGGRGSLFGFARVVALNLINNTQAEQHPHASDGVLAGLADSADWESKVLRGDQQARFHEAFREAVLLLTARQRALLRLNLLEGLSIDELAALYGTHRSTAARWLAEARAALDLQTRRRLAALLSIDAGEVERLLAATQSGFQLSLGRALRQTLPPA